MGLGTFAPPGGSGDVPPPGAHRGTSRHVVCHHIVCHRTTSSCVTSHRRGAFGPRRAAAQQWPLGWPRPTAGWPKGMGTRSRGTGRGSARVCGALGAAPGPATVPPAPKPLSEAPAEGKGRLWGSPGSASTRTSPALREQRDSRGPSQRRPLGKIPRVGAAGAVAYSSRGVVIPIYDLFIRLLNFS